MEDDQYMDILSIYTSSVLQDFGSFLRTQIDSVEDDIKLVSDGYNSSFITYELQPDIYTFKDIFEVHLNFLQSEYKGEINKIVIEFDDITRKTELVVKPGLVAVRFDKNRFLVLSEVLLQVGITNTIINILVKKLET